MVNVGSSSPRTGGLSRRRRREGRRASAVRIVFYFDDWEWVRSVE